MREKTVTLQRGERRRNTSSFRWSFWW